MTIEQAIKKAIEGGYKSGRVYNQSGEDIVSNTPIEILCLDPQFWQALGKAMGWYPLNASLKDYPELRFGDWKKGNWLSKWHKFIDYLAEGGSIEGFFEKLEK